MTERDDQICALYRSGSTQLDLAKQFQLSEVRIGQILKKLGLTKEDRADAPKRTKFTGIHLTDEIKDALRLAAKRDGVSMSAWIAAVIKKELHDRGIDAEIATYLKEEDVHLPWDIEP